VPRDWVLRNYWKSINRHGPEHKQAWAGKWEESDIIIEGDLAAQQGIRFNIFQLNQTYTGEDERLNIGPKGFTGEKYGGSTYWDTEAFALPFYLCTANPDIAKNLLVYRYKHLEKAIQNAEKLGFTDGAALYPMVTMNGEECHNEWEITFEEIHRNGAIAYAIHNYIRHTGDEAYLAEYGLEVLISISRFWRQRVNFSEEKQQFVMLGVTGPNEYENNVNNNWYTNTIAVWTLEYTLASIEKVRKGFPERFAEIIKKLDFEPDEEMASWKEMIENMYFPYSEKYNVFLQQDGYLDKKAMLAGDLDPEQRPLNQHWSWDRILRSPFIKQADVLQGIYFFEERYDIETIRRNFEFYEARTVHESSLSPCIHSILASRIGDIDCAYNLYLRTSRLDLDDYNKEVAEGLHITSMGGTWLSIVEGFGGMRIRNGMLSFHPRIPEQWKSYSFHVRFRGNLTKVIVHPKTAEIQNLSDKDMQVELYGSEYLLEKHKNIKVSQ
jgi:maltose phosphorylase